MSLQDSRSRLLELFSGPTSEVPSRWAKLWDAGDFLPFDRGCPNPAFEDVLSQRTDVLGTATQDSNGENPGTRKRALVPGCGRGYDVLLLASFGYEAYGLEISETAVEKCKEEQEKNGHKYPTRHEAVGAGSATFITGDFFNPETWVDKTSGSGKFELIYDYTVDNSCTSVERNEADFQADLTMKFLSALPPSMRPAWSKTMSQLLSTTPIGHLICVEFPTYKDPLSGGPPWALPSDVYLGHLSHPGEEISYNKQGLIQPDDSKPRSQGGLERIAHWKPERTHEIGKGTDWISMWQHTLDRAV